MCLRIGEYISPELFCFVSLTSSCSLIPWMTKLVYTEVPCRQRRMSQSWRSMAKIRTDRDFHADEDAVTRLVVKATADYLNSKAERSNMLKVWCGRKRMLSMFDYYFWGFNVYITVDLVKHGVLTHVGEVRRYRNDRCYYYHYFGVMSFHLNSKAQKSEARMTTSVQKQDPNA